MTWLTPLIGIITAAIAIPALLILYFLKLRRRDLDISTTLMWKKAIQDLQANAPFQRLRRNILLILQLLALAGILVALAQPQIKGQTVAAARHVIMIDRSGSMLARDVDDGRGGRRTRLEEAKKQAIALVESMRESGLVSTEKSDEAMVIAFDTQADVRQQFTSDKSALRRVIEAITPTEGPTSVEEAMRLARAHRPKRVIEGAAIEGLEGGDNVTIQLYTDGRLPDAARAKPASDDSVEFHRIGSEDAANVGIVALRSERSYEDPTKLSLFVSMQNNEREARTVDVELSLDGRVAGIKSVTLPGAGDGPALSGVARARAEAQEAEARRETGVTGGSARAPSAPTTPGIGGVVFQLDRPEGAMVLVRLRDPGTNEPLSKDVLDLDDQAWIVVPPAKKMTVAIVSPKGNLFLSSALSGLPLARLMELTPEQFEQKRLGGGLGEFDVVILDGWLPSETAGEFLPAGRFLVMGAVPDKLGNAASGLVDQGVASSAGMVDWRRDHPVMRNLNLDSVIASDFRQIAVQPGSGVHTLADSDKGPAIVELSTADTRSIVVPWDVASSTWPFDVSFVVFVASSIGYLGEDASVTGSVRAVQPGSVLSDRVPSEAQDVTIAAPSGEKVKLTPAADGRVVFGPLTKRGVYEVSWTGPAGTTDERVDGRHVRRYAANLLDSNESSIGAQDRVELANKIVAASGVSGAADRKLWPWLLLGALAFVMFEWYIYNRKVHI